MKKPLPDIKALVSMYVIDRMNIRQIALFTGVSRTRVNQFLKEDGVDFRTQGYETTPNLDNKEWLETEYVLKRKSMVQIGAEIGCSPCTIVRWMKIHGIAARHGEPGHLRNDSEEVREKMRIKKMGKYDGPNNPNWRGGISPKDPDRNRYPSKMWARAVKERDGYKCQDCGSPEELHSHHIKSWRGFPMLRYDVSNGTTLCHECHEKRHQFRFPHRKTRRTATSASAPA